MRPRDGGAAEITVRATVEASSRHFVVEVADRGAGLRGQTLEQLKTEFGSGGIGGPTGAAGRSQVRARPVAACHVMCLMLM